MVGGIGYLCRWMERQTRVAARPRMPQLCHTRERDDCDEEGPMLPEGQRVVLASSAPTGLA